MFLCTSNKTIQPSETFMNKLNISWLSWIICLKIFSFCFSILRCYPIQNWKFSFQFGSILLNTPTGVFLCVLNNISLILVSKLWPFKSSLVFHILNKAIPGKNRKSGSTNYFVQTTMIILHVIESSQNKCVCGVANPIVW